MDNVTTEGTLRAFVIMKNTNKVLREMGKIPYGKRKATPAERKIQKEMAQEAELQELLNG